MQNDCEWENSDPITDITLFPFGKFAAVDTIFFNDQYLVVHGMN